MQRILWVSRVLWDQVVVPWVLRPAHKATPRHRPLDPEVVSCVLRVGEAAFPLVALCCRAVAPRPERYGEASEHYRAIEDAAAAQCPRCVAWIIAHNNNDDAGAEPEAGGSGRRRRRRKAKEQIAVMTGLCRGGHLGTVKAFVGSRGACECWVEQEGEGEKVHQLWAQSISPDAEEAAAPGTSLMNWNSVATTTNLSKEPILSEEFWSARGFFKLTQEVCAKGKLDVLKWILSSFFQINEGNKFMLDHFLHEAAQNGHLDVIKWLVDTFDLSDFADKCCALGANFRPFGSVYDVKRFVESFPEWTFDGGAKLAVSAALFKGPSSADEIIEVCQWLTDRFSLRGMDFIDWFEVPKYPEVIKWILSDITEEGDLYSIWNLTCSELSNIELGKWFIEEKGITPTEDDFMTACSSTRDNLAFIEWLYKQVSVSSSDLLSSLHRALARKNESNSRWLEQTYISTVNSRPKISLVKISAMYKCSVDEGWLEWLFTHTSMCDIDCSDIELVKFVNECIERNQLHCALSAWERFSLSPITNRDLLLSILTKLLVCGSLSQVKQVESISGGFTPSEIWDCLSHCTLIPESSKIVKWLVKECTRNVSDPAAVTPKNFPDLTRMFAELIRWNKRGCVKWLFNRFHFPEIPAEVGNLHNDIDLATWKLLLRLFPDINRDVVTQHFMGVAIASPLHSQFSINALGVTLNDIAQFCQDSTSENDNNFGLNDTKQWLEWATRNHGINE
ncbi:hypothetical protein Pelo_3099 [Pelomyxa schiedti]|nr:hypothetical protein Pelo_3099 [Pelomyxa schiedti]